ncbi:MULTISPECIES: YqiA/YcfP family alpha/beta fold hydrolase [unclassified Acinetobacter]|uniref:YqiA/YcfP family alpha/beta fold hydrolase n=1 Tax=unclassified Acinetobacter TaxID=196816 RepID=UPI002934DC06|nr:MULTISPECIES: YqiA/YcfP family alpha/beta fold hydrolase [unclassified Acinetobacter]WOE30942.1 YqiA/YcfP family alpha/beta fold hydrolase [Acinetobacter sp. SAAs470]WOE39138.1 YqiA/YcfP family alpha/beta fold hydrolase [Acinetobacter sp. SAAs474]
MNFIYLHGFQSSPQSAKGQLLKHYIENKTPYHIDLPDLNKPPRQVLQQLQQQLQHQPKTVLIGSSLGGFYATQLAARYHIAAAVINPVIQPWLLFQQLFADCPLPYHVTPNWCLDQTQLQDLQDLALPFVQDASKLLVLLQQGDEVLDYREAQRYYSQTTHQSFIMTDNHGNHAMDDFIVKIPMIVQFLSDSIA